MPLNLFSRVTFTILLVLQTLTTTAQDSIVTPVEKHWRSWGRISLIFNQSAFNEEWQGGGVSQISGDININYDLAYKHKKLSWDNKIIAEYGLAQIRHQRFTRKTTDRFEINSILGNQIKTTHWYYSILFNFKTQFASGYDFFEREQTDANGNATQIEDRNEVSGSFSPTYIQFGPGILWKKNKHFNINFAPATTRLILVSPRFTRVDTNNEEALSAYEPFFGVEANKTTRIEVGAALRGYAKFQLMTNIHMEHNLSLYFDYLDRSKNVDIDYTLNLYLKVNKYISGNFAFQAIYDDNTIRGFQIRQVIGLGFKYDFGEAPPKKKEA